MATAFTPASQALIADALLCATNEGKMYDEFLSVALITRDVPRDTADSAAKWVKVASEYLPIYYRNGGDRLNAAHLLAFAAELAIYYGDHLREFSRADIEALMVRVLTPAT